METFRPDENRYVIDQESSVEMARLMELDILTTKCMGSLFPSDIDLSNIHDVLDVACGPGGWVSEVAFAHPDKQVVGADISHAMLGYARAYAEVQGLKNTTFYYRSATEPLDFPDNAFDFVNSRFMVGFMWKEAWANYVQECARIIRPGGIIRLTESDCMSGLSAGNSIALSWFNRIMVRAFYRTGRSFCEDEDGYQVGVTPMLPKFLREAGFQDVREQPHLLNFSADTETRERMFKNLQIGLKLVQPFLIKAGVTTEEEVEGYYQQMITDFMSEDFHAAWYFTSVYGVRGEK
jgi:ubiquinone/menaquinone biosynthesis C-methylase UbiE